MTNDNQRRLIELSDQLLNEAEKPLDDNRLRAIEGLLCSALDLVDDARRRVRSVRVLSS
jgi:hypothetical protein